VIQALGRGGDERVVGSEVPCCGDEAEDLELESETEGCASCGGSCDGRET